MYRSCSAPRMGQCFIFPVLGMGGQPQSFFLRTAQEPASMAAISSSRTQRVALDIIGGFVHSNAKAGILFQGSGLGRPGKLPYFRAKPPPCPPRFPRNHDDACL